MTAAIRHRSARFPGRKPATASPSSWNRNRIGPRTCAPSGSMRILPLCRLDGPWRPDALFRSYRHLRRRCDDEGPRHDRPRNRRWVLELTNPESRTLHTGLSGIAAQAAMDRVRASPLRQLLGVVGATGSVPGLKHTLNIRRQRGWRSKASATGFRHSVRCEKPPPLPFANLGPIRLFDIQPQRGRLTRACRPRGFGKSPNALG